MAKSNLTKLAVLILVSVLGYALGSYRAMQYHNRVLQAQWDAEIARFEYAYDQVDSCSSDQCLEVWSELLGRDVEAK